MSPAPRNREQPKEGRHRSYDLYVFGIASMTVDHIGAVFFPHILIFRVIGRLALPIFVYGLVQGFSYTKSWQDYFLRLAVFGGIAQYPFVKYFEKWDLNILFLLAISLVVLKLLQQKNWIGLAAVALLMSLVPVEYGLYGIAMAVIYHLFSGKPFRAFAAQAGLTLVYSLYIGLIWQAFAIFGVAIALFYKGRIFDYHFGRWFFYIYYPAHLMIFLLVKLLLQ